MGCASTSVSVYSARLVPGISGTGSGSGGLVALSQAIRSELIAKINKRMKDCFVVMSRGNKEVKKIKQLR